MRGNIGFCAKMVETIFETSAETAFLWSFFDILAFDKLLAFDLWCILLLWYFMRARGVPWAFFGLLDCTCWYLCTCVPTN